MRIDLNTGAAVSGAHVEKAALSHAAQTKAKSVSSQPSDTEAHVGKLAATALSAPEVRTEKVRALQLQLQSGKYQVSSTQVAGAVLEQMRVHG